MYNEELEHINEDYFDWLYGQIEERDDAYLDLCRHLNGIEFNYDTALMIPNDYNRIEDAVGIRDKYRRREMKDSYSRYLTDEFMDQSCSVFEILVALAYRMEGVVMTDQFPMWFWILIENLGMDRFDNVRFNAKKVDKILDIWMNRKYDQDGSGGLFPLKDPPSDQRDEEIWHQMSSYLLENYG